MDNQPTLTEVAARRLRLAVVSTPRSGNTWLRRLLAAAHGLRELGAHAPEGVDWADLPDRCVLQIHWMPDGAFVERLHRAEMRVITLARHPLDVLLSALNYNEHVHPAEGCTRPGCGRCAILGAAPWDPEFLDYACGPWGGELLGFSPAWWDRPGVSRVVYERLATDPLGVFSTLVEDLGHAPTADLGATVDAHTPERMRLGFGADAHQVWQAMPGHWRSLIPEATARAIYEARRDVFEALGYACDPDPSLTPAAAERAWGRLQIASARRLLAEERGRFRASAAEGLARSEAAAALAEEAERRALRDQWEREVAQTQRDAALAETDSRQAEILRLTWEVGVLTREIVEARSTPKANEDRRDPEPPRIPTKRPSGIGAWRR